MNNNIVDKIAPDLDKISKFISFKRGSLKSSIESSLINFEENTFEEKVILKENLERHQSDLSTLQVKHNDLKLNNSKLNLEVDSLQVKHKDLEINNSKLNKEVGSLIADNKKVKTKLGLINNILSATNSENIPLEKFKKLLKNDFMDFANSESSLAEEAKAVLLLQSIEKELELIVNFSGIYNKNIIAIGGGFSGGKSAFVSSFFEDSKIKLPIGIKPVTAIPTYIINGKENSVKGFSKDGGVVEIETDLYKKLSHDFVKSFSFNLKDIMPVMAIDTPMGKYNDICFVDTPGYNPAETDGFTSEDKATAMEYLDQANSLIWMIGLDSNGTIPAKDLDFLDELNIGNKKLYIVANKADLRADSDLEEILDEIEESLDEYDIPFNGISAYSSNTKKEYIYRKTSLFDFLQSENNPSHVKKKIWSELNGVMNSYKDAISDDILKSKKMKKDLTALELDLLESGYDGDSEKFNDRMSELKASFSTKDLEKQLKQASLISDKMLTSIKEIFNNL